MNCDSMLNLLSMSTYELYSWIAIGILVAFLLLFRILMKYYTSSSIMYFIFSKATIILTSFTIKADDPSEWGPWVFYTTFSTLMFCLGPTFFFEGYYFEITIHIGIFSNSVDGMEHSRGYKFYYFFSRLIIIFVAVNIIGFGVNPYLLYVIPSICSIIVLIILIKSYRS